MNFILGIGNPLRSDDGVGPYIVQKLERMGLENVATRIAQQVHLEVLEEIIKFDRIILVDAATEGKDVDLRRVVTSEDRSLVSSHHLSPEVILGLSRRLYQKDLELWTCSVKAECFNIGEGITPAVQACADRAVGLIYALIRG